MSSAQRLQPLGSQSPSAPALKVITWATQLALDHRPLALGESARQLSQLLVAAPALHARLLAARAALWGAAQVAAQADALVEALVAALVAALVVALVAGVAASLVVGPAGWVVGLLQVALELPASALRAREAVAKPAAFMKGASPR